LALLINPLKSIRVYITNIAKIIASSDLLNILEHTYPMADPLRVDRNETKKKVNI
jgi:hypothetical protein